MTYAVLDVESTIYKKGHPFASRNKLCLVGIRIDYTNHIFEIEYTDRPYGKELDTIHELLAGVDFVVGFNLKFDLNWLARYGIWLPYSCRVFDCQLVEFILAHQLTPFPSLDSCLAKYGLGAKLDIVARDYWDRGIDTPNIPQDLLVQYLEKDLELTDELYKILQARIREQRSLEPLISLHMQDLRILQEMEFNGIYIDWSAMEQATNETEKELDGIKRQILDYCPSEARGWFNTGSNDHVSALLYGGTISGREASPYEHQIKTGPRTGEIVSRNRWHEFSVTFPRLVEPLPKTALKKEGFWGTGADILRELPKPKRLLKLLLKEAELSKLLTTYYVGLAKKREEMDWQDGCIHSNLNQSTVITGRLSSSGPNQQNMPIQMSEFIVTRF